MPTGSTDLKYSDIFNETGVDNVTNHWYDLNAYSWSEGPPPGDNSRSYWGTGTRSAVAGNILYNPSINGAGAGVTSNYAFVWYRNYYGYMDQTAYTVDLYVENNIAPATRPDPPNNVDVDCGLYNEALTSNSICGISAGGVMEGGGTFGPTDQSQPYTFNVNYFYVDGLYANAGTAPYNVDIWVNGNLEYNNSVGGSVGPVVFNYTQFANLAAQNNGSGFDISFYFS